MAADWVLISAVAQIVNATAQTLKTVIDLLDRYKKRNDQTSELAAQAKADLERGDHESAIAKLSKLILLEPKSPQGYHMRGRCYLHKVVVSWPRLNEYDLDRAHADLLEARRLDPTTEVCHACGYLAVNHIMRSDIDFAAKDYHRAIERLYTAQSLVPMSGFLTTTQSDKSFLNFFLNSAGMDCRLRAMAYVEEEKPDGVIEEANQLLQLSPKDPHAYFLRGFAYFRKENCDRAIDDLSEALKIDPKWGGAPERAVGLAYGLRGAMHIKKGDLDRAIDDYSEALRLDPQDTESREKLAIIYTRRGARYGQEKDYDHAIADFSEALRLSPQNSEFRKCLAITYHLRGLRHADDCERAIADLSEAHQLDTQDGDCRKHLAIAFKNRGIALLSEGHLDRAAADLSAAMQLGVVDEDVRKELETCNELIRSLRELEERRKERIDNDCEKAIAETAVEARRWVSTNSTHPMIKLYTDYAERFYKVGAVGVWFNKFMDEDESGEGALIPQSLIVALPPSHSEKQKLVEFFTELLEKEISVDPDTAGDCDVGDRYCQFTIHDGKVILDFVSNCKVVLGEATLAVPTLHVEIAVQNLAFDKVVGIVFTTDNWTTAQTACGTYSSSEMNGLIEVWKVEATVGSATEVKFAVFHRAAGSENWDNNFGRNYRVTPSRPQRFGSAP
jgi:tetratricopeptide (TPR) repeat protein